MNKKKYTKPATTIMGMHTYGAMLVGSNQTDFADSKKNNQGSDLWDTDDDATRTNWAGYRNYHTTGANERFEEE